MTKKLKKILIRSILGLVLLSLGLSILFARMAVYPVWYRHYQFPKREASGQLSPGQAEPVLPPCSHYQDRVYRHCHDPKIDLKLDYENVILTDPILTTGWWVKANPNSRKAMVILVHGGGADRRAMLKHVRYLHDAGYDTFLIDCFNHGLTGGNGKGISLGYHEAESIVAASRFARKTYPLLPVITMGTSQGGFSVLRAAALEPQSVDGVISENPYVSVERILLEFNRFFWVEKAPRFIKRLALFWMSQWIGIDVHQLDVHVFSANLQKTKIFLIHGDADQVVDLQHSKDILEILGDQKSKNQTIEFWQVPGGKHEFLWNERQEEYQKRILTWLMQLQKQE